MKCWATLGRALIGMWSSCLICSITTVWSQINYFEQANNGIRCIFFHGTIPMVEMFNALNQKKSHHKQLHLFLSLHLQPSIPCLSKVILTSSYQTEALPVNFMDINFIFCLSRKSLILKTLSTASYQLRKSPLCTPVILLLRSQFLWWDLFHDIALPRHYMLVVRSSLVEWVYFISHLTHHPCHPKKMVREKLSKLLGDFLYFSKAMKCLLIYSVVLPLPMHTTASPSPDGIQNLQGSIQGHS